MAGRSDQPPPADRSAPTDWRRTWLTPRAIAMHVTLFVVVPAFAGLFWWQVQRVRQGNMLSWAYVFEWPFFAAYAVYMWWRLVHDQAADANADTAPAVANRSKTTAPVAAAPVAAAPGAPPATEPAESIESTGGRQPVSHQDEDEEEMAAYNRYLAELDASGRRKHW